ncbi:hypothetical protein TVAG_306680 [Trichomonas vaginalis G3]|uniref:Right handed beta helix domain-containing protein n=1 Tax=Trichomonas vaginalis (strain ATCC PRA-98 / G3) TaxID=412133 RepID=A2DNF8_TRIV3|nr:hypothetical protein TVAGG3_1024890 [Trichomonas vaginalis G3]EAY18146.1 hypothetical protein TVAG_306680 [Trichomonas vaginalis G3]KAI5492423.1 hypothetical protein TVAGG3_1024890 [Trichomonas vaginalis G3]|eukprot:XP_001579132.1 hypothetical protein [Trichomonas vaginalis G3]
MNLLFLALSIHKESENSCISTSHNVFSHTIKGNDNICDIDFCQFFNLHQNGNGGAISLEKSIKSIKIQNSLFTNCTSTGKAGAVFIILEKTIVNKNCFASCCCGTGNGCDGSTFYSEASNWTFHTQNSYDKCPAHHINCWYGICIFWKGDITSEDVNVSNSHVSFVSGLAHGAPVTSKIHRYCSYNGKEGNSLTFINNMDLIGDHKYGIIVKNVASTGLIYVQSSIALLSNFIFKDNQGPWTYMCVAGYATFQDCRFDKSDGNKGNAWKTNINCNFNDNQIVYSFDNDVLCQIDHSQENKVKKHINLVYYPLILVVLFLIFKYCNPIAFFRRKIGDKSKPNYFIKHDLDYFKDVEMEK